MARAPKKKASARSKTSSRRTGERAATTRSAKTAKRAKQMRGSSAAKKKPAAAKKKPAAAKKKPVPAKKKPVPAKKKPVPAKKKPAAAKKSPPKRPGPKAATKAAPKMAPAEPAPREKPKKKAKPEVTPREIRKIKATLEQQRTTLTREYTVLQEDSFLATQSDAGGEAGFDEEFADAGSFTFEREKDLSIGQNIRDLVDKVEHALAAIEAGTYGICESCGNPIRKARLLALPYSTLCLTCKQQEERTR